MTFFQLLEAARDAAPPAPSPPRELVPESALLLNPVLARAAMAKRSRGVDRAPALRFEDVA